MDNAVLKTEKVSKKYTDKVGYTINLLKDISIVAEKNQFTTILAPVGSGKTSLLKILSGLDEPTSGIVETESKNRVMIPSKPSSFPWLNVEQNVRFNTGYDLRKIEEIIKSIGLHGYENHFPNNKSEGFRFRVSLGRAIANNPDMILIDEPFNNLNTLTRQEIYMMLRSFMSGSFKTFILGTTNITEAIFLSDKIYIMKKNPGEILDEIKISLPQNRTLDILESDEFISIRTRIENIFKQRADRQLYNFSI